MNICVITGSRAEYGLLKNIMIEINNNKLLNLQLIVTGSHLMKDYGNTYNIIENDGFIIDKKIEFKLDGDNPENILCAMGDELITFSNVYNELKPKIILILGDRYEILIPAICAIIYKIPIVHLCGGDITEGSYDNDIRNAITSMSDLHFVTNNKSYDRLKIMNKDVVISGHPGLENINSFYKYSYYILEQLLDTKFNDFNILVVFHSPTMSTDIKTEIFEFILLLHLLCKHTYINIYMLGTNIDTNNKLISNNFKKIAKCYNNAYYYESLEQTVYFNLASACNCYIGNSSSGIYELPYLIKYIINVGDRQKGRLYASNIINCKCNEYDIYIIYILIYNRIISIDNVNYKYISLRSSKIIIDKMIEKYGLNEQQST